MVATALPECTNPDDVSITIKAFLSADLLIELIEFLEKIIIEPLLFSNNKNLQNLLLLTAIHWIGAADTAEAHLHVLWFHSLSLGILALHGQFFFFFGIPLTQKRSPGGNTVKGHRSGHPEVILSQNIVVGRACAAVWDRQSHAKCVCDGKQKRWACEGVV